MLTPGVRPARPRRAARVLVLLGLLGALTAVPDGSAQADGAGGAASYPVVDGLPRDVSQGCGTLDVPVSGTRGELADVALGLTLTHTWVGDLEVTLTAPDGTSTPVFGDVGRTTGLYGAPADLGGAYTFSDAGDQTLRQAYDAGATVVLPPGTYRASTVETARDAGGPSGLTAAFARLRSADGTWVLRLCDRYAPANPLRVSAADLRLVVVPDDVGPTVDLLAPADGARVRAVEPFAFSAPDADVAAYECRLDDAAYEACTSPFDPPGARDEGPHRVAVRATDTSGNLGPAATRGYTLDVTPAVVVLEDDDADHQDDEVLAAAPSVAFSSPDADVATFRCATDDGPFADCTSPYRPPLTGPAASGRHAVAVRAVDDAGNRGAPVRRSFTLDTRAPAVRVTAGPADGARLAAPPRFGFTSPADDVVGYECRLDGVPFAACTSPRRLATEPGRHRFAVRAVDAVGHHGRAVSRTFTLRDLGCERATAALRSARTRLDAAQHRLRRARASGDRERTATAQARVGRATAARDRARASVQRAC